MKPGKFIANLIKIKALWEVMNKTGHGVKLAGTMGYKLGYGMAKHPNIHKFKRQVQDHPAASLTALLGVGLGIIGITGFLLKRA